MGNIFFVIPLFSQRIWGGKKIKEFFSSSGTFGGLNNANENKIGEAWVISGLDQKSCYIFEMNTYNHEPTKYLLSDFYRTNRKKLFNNCPYEEYPLLAKILDSNQNLSVQTHPSLKYIKKHNDANTKHEAWYVLDCKKDAKVIIGHKAMDKKEFIKYVNNNQWNDLLITIDNVRKGDLYYIPSGTIHALCKGNFIYEIQQSCDITFRLYDYGRDRPLQIEQCIESTTIPHVKISNNSDKLNILKTKFFNMCVIDLPKDKGNGKKEIYLPYNYFLQLTVIEGKMGIICCDTDEGQEIWKGHSLIICKNRHLKFQGEGKVIITYIQAQLLD